MAIRRDHRWPRATELATRVRARVTASPRVRARAPSARLEDDSARPAREVLALLGEAVAGRTVAVAVASEPLGHDRAVGVEDDLPTVLSLGDGRSPVLRRVGVPGPALRERGRSRVGEGFGPATPPTGPEGAVVRPPKVLPAGCARARAQSRR